jgi:hypothetical protein
MVSLPRQSIAEAGLKLMVPSGLYVTTKYSKATRWLIARACIGVFLHRDETLK